MTGPIVLAGCFAAGLIALFATLRIAPGFAAAKPGARSNHVRPTPQIGGLVMVPLWIAAMAALTAWETPVPVFGDVPFLAGIAILYATGIVDDLADLGPAPKLVAQFVAAALVAWSLTPLLPSAWLLLILPVTVVFLVGMANLANFIDGLDLMAVATLGLPSLAFALLAAAGTVLAGYAPAGFAMAGLFAAFALVNAPPARSFLGDGGSLPFGLVLGAMTVIVAVEASPVAALLLPAYLLLDGVYTILRRLRGGENILKAHSTHVYQRAVKVRSRPAIAAVVAAIGLLAGIVLQAVAGAGVPAAIVGCFVVLLAWIAAAAWLLGRGPFSVRS